MVAEAVTRTAALRLLFARLNWPLKQVKLLAAREIATLLVHKECAAEALVRYLEWLSNRKLESEIVSGLAVLFCMKPEELPPYNMVDDAIGRASLLSAGMLASVYDRSVQVDDLGHSGIAPNTFVPDSYFLRSCRADAPPLFGHNLNRLEKINGLPFTRQWAYEQKMLTEETGSPLSEYPYHFFGDDYTNSGLTGQFNFRQSDIFLSAYLRALAVAVTEWSMPPRLALDHAADALPTQHGLIEIRPVPRPPWLGAVPDACCEPNVELSDLARFVLQAGRRAGDMSPIFLSVPIWKSTKHFADLTIRSLMVSGDLREFASEAAYEDRNILWPIRNPTRLEGSLEQEDIAEYLTTAGTGRWAPICLSMWPTTIGLWHVADLPRGIVIPAPYCFEGKLELRCHRGGIRLSVGGDAVANWCTWYDHWMPVYPDAGGRGCGTLVEAREPDVAKALNKHNMSLAWSVEVRQWVRETDYGDFKLHSRRAFLGDTV